MKASLRKTKEAHRPKSASREGLAGMQPGMDSANGAAAESTTEEELPARLTDSANALHTTHLAAALENEENAGEIRAEPSEARRPDEERTAVMSNYVKLANEAGDQYLTALSDSQEQFLNYMKAFASWTPAVSPMPVPPFAQDYFPTPREVLEANFSFATKLLKQQKTFADKLFAAGNPVG